MRFLVKASPIRPSPTTPTRRIGSKAAPGSDRFLRAVEPGELFGSELEEAQVIETFPTFGWDN